jgi:hypothetical protein
MHRANNTKWQTCPCRYDTALWIVENEADLCRELARVFEQGFAKIKSPPSARTWSLFLTGDNNQTRISVFAVIRTFIVDELRLSREDAHIIIGRWAANEIAERYEAKG